MTIERKLSPTHEAPYRGLRVLDFGQGIASPYCAMLLGVYGADVIKVEPPEGDWSLSSERPMEVTPRCRRSITAASAAFAST
jgi:crotonobetainyl-CoA:carnitine CoA-transferase CaiB-like acyl-CoA transferase